MISTELPHILVIPSSYPTLESPLSGIFFYEQAQALAKQGCKTGVIYLNITSLKNVLKERKNGMTLIREGLVNTIRYQTPNIFPKLHTLFLKRYLTLGLKLFEAYIKNFGRPDILHAHTLTNAGLLAHYIYEKYRIPYVLTEHNSKFINDSLAKKQLKQLLPVIHKASFCFAVSQNFCSHLDTLFGIKKWLYLPNLVSDVFLNTALQPVNNNNFVFSSVAILNKQKNIDLLIQSFALFNRDYPYSSLIIGGDGPEREKLEKLVTALNLSHCVSFLGKLSRNQVVNTILSSHVFVLASQIETFGVVLIEALALGKPIISTKSGGPQSIITPEVGCLVENLSEQSIYQCMTDIYTNYHHFNPQQLREYCRKNYSEDSICTQLIHFYQRTILQQHE